ncbi:hypothetical protein J19TS2_46550 [Cohnella xylanilytica]|nr:hypothetical protein J19TS2_46550 [Cohnella xylanilytica]
MNDVVEPAPISAPKNPEWLMAELTVTPEPNHGAKEPDSKSPFVTRLFIVIFSHHPRLKFD